MGKEAWVPVSIRMPDDNPRVHLKMKCHSLATDLYDIGWRDPKRKSWMFETVVRFGSFCADRH